MAKQGQGTRISLQGAAGVDFSAQVFKVVKLTAAKTVDLCTVAGENALGIIEAAPYNPGGAAVVLVEGETKAVAGGAVTVNALLTTDASGRVVAASTGNYIIGRALTAAGGAGELVEIFLNPAGAKA